MEFSFSFYAEGDHLIEMVSVDDQVLVHLEDQTTGHVYTETYGNPDGFVGKMLADTARDALTHAYQIERLKEGNYIVFHRS